MDYDLRILLLDVSITMTGYAFFKVSTGNSFAFQLVDFGVIDSTVTAVGVDTDSRTRLLLGEVATLVDRHKINCLIVEEPPETTYGWKTMTKVAIVGRSAKLSKVVAAVYGIVGYAFITHLNCRLIAPVQWQAGRARASKMKSKPWSIKAANAVLKYLRNQRKLKADEDHTADAINIGIHAITKFSNKEWELPSLTDGGD